MNSITELFLISFKELKTSFNKYIIYYFLFVIISIFDLSSDLLIPKSLDSLKLGITLVIFFLTIISSILFLRTQKKDSVAGDFWYIFIPFLLYSIYYSIIGLLGLFLLFIPGVLFFYAPIIGTFHNNLPPFKTSFKMAKENYGMAIFLSVGSLLLEIIPMLFKLIPNLIVSSVFTFMFSFIDSFFYIILMMMTVRFYYSCIEKFEREGKQT